MFLDPEIVRSVERVIIVCGGILAIYLGYGLFKIATIKHDGAGRMKSDLFEFSVTKVGPGVFFALFGAAILWVALKSPISVNEVDSGIIAQLRVLVDDIPDKEKRQSALDIVNSLSTPSSMRFRHYYGNAPLERPRPQG